MHRIFSVIPFLLAIFSVQLAHASDDFLDKQIDAIITDMKAGDQHAAEYRKVRRYHKLDVDEDGIKDVIALFTIEGFNGGNNYHFYIAALRGNGDEFSFIDAIEIGREGNRHIDFNEVTVRNGKIVVGTREYVRNSQQFDPNCCPSKKAQAVFEIKNGKLQEHK